MSTSQHFPVPNSTLPYWRTELHEIDSFRSSEELPEECDILIIGAGLSGVSMAYHLLHDNPSPPSIVLLEAREICSGATGRNGGHLCMAHRTVELVTGPYGPEAARELAIFQAAQAPAIKQVVDSEKIDCDLLLTRRYEVYLNQEHADEQQALHEKHIAAGLDYIQDIDFVGPKYAERVSGVKGAKIAISTAAAQIWPYKFVTGLLAKLVAESSINVQSHTPVTSVSISENWTSAVTTPRGSIRAKKVVFATNAYTSGILPLFNNKITPVKGTCSHISVPSDTKFPPPHLSHTFGVSFDFQYRDYLIPRPDGGVICGGASDTFREDTESWFNVSDDSTLFKTAHTHFESVMQNNFRGWEKSGAKMDHIWTGIMGSTVDGLPHCGKVPGTKSQFIIAGFNGGGMSHIFLAAKGVAKMILEGVSFEESGIPRVFKSTKDRLVRDVTP